MWGNVGLILTGEKPNDLEGNIFQCHYFHYESHIGLPGLKPGP